MKPVITISRYWHNPQIMTVIWKEGISLTIGLADFIAALKKEMGDIPIRKEKKYFFITRVSVERDLFESRLETAINRVCEKIKEESGKVMAMTLDQEEKV